MLLDPVFMYYQDISIIWYTLYSLGTSAHDGEMVLMYLIITHSKDEGGVLH